MGSFLEHFWWSWERSLEKWPKCKIEQHYSVLATFWGLGGSRWRLLGSILGDLGHKLGSLGRSWRQVGNFLATCCEKVGRRWAQMANLSRKSERGTLGMVRYGGCRWHLSARGDPPGAFKESWKIGIGRIGHQIYTRPTTAPRGRRIQSKTPCGGVSPPTPLSLFWHVEGCALGGFSDCVLRGMPWAARLGMSWNGLDQTGLS